MSKTIFKNLIKKNKLLSSIARSILRSLRKDRDFNSKKYWEERYESGGNSGAGSYGRLAKFKAEAINDFIKEKNINTVLEFGCGDGHQLSLFNIPKYIGFDVSKKSITVCKDKFEKENSKSFFLYDPQYFYDNLKTFSVDATMSLDVIFHLVEDDVYEKYMNDLFASANKYVIIYSSNTDRQTKAPAQHVKHRKFTDWISRNLHGWELMTKIDNEFTLKEDPEKESFADFYFYRKI